MAARSACRRRPDRSCPYPFPHELLLQSMLVIGLGCWPKSEPKPKPDVGLSLAPVTQNPTQPNPTQPSTCKSRNRYMLCHQKMHCKHVPHLVLGWVCLGWVGSCQVIGPIPDEKHANPAEAQPDVGLGRVGLGKIRHKNKHTAEQLSLSISQDRQREPV
jgi:hypothetical protein